MFWRRIKTCFITSLHLIRAFSQMLYGVWRISRLERPIVTIFGSAVLGENTLYCKEAHKLAAMFVKRNISVLTGGGAGIMQAASCGAIVPKSKKNIDVIGIGVRDLGEAKNPCVSEYFELNRFYSRKYLLTRFSIGFIIFPGGYGTLDEFFEVLTLIKTHNMRRVPIILIGKEFWQPFVAWLKSELLKNKTIPKEALELFMVTDNLEEACALVCSVCDNIGERKA